MILRELKKNLRGKGFDRISSSKLKALIEAKPEIDNAIKSLKLNKNKQSYTKALVSLKGIKGGKIFNCLIDLDC